ncbi:endonuclease [Kiloniella laminariae]|uniref:Endonuclease n=1 Tax=Kiloniella laminariae TaxID=454162 RepID=A0ABT4LEX9_9PROT|nr:endonuclease [Kiloniella laminariae]MCZ4279650.1 endonuclease [Kiloniella laminariae]
MPPYKSRSRKSLSRRLIPPLCALFAIALIILLKQIWQERSAHDLSAQTSAAALVTSGTGSPIQVPPRPTSGEQASGEQASGELQAEELSDPPGSPPSEMAGLPLPAAPADPNRALAEQVPLWQPESWREAKNAADDVIFQDRPRSFYCGCRYSSDGDSDGSGKIDPVSIEGESCGYKIQDKHKNRAGRVEWEHVVPASLMPARNFDCWTKEADGKRGSRSRCEKESPAAQAMIFDLHNLVPAIGQVNALRGNDRYGELPAQTSDFGRCEIEDTNSSFAPPPCKRGDVARIWLYMSARHGVALIAGEADRFERWSKADPVSPWERGRHDRVARLTGIENPFVARIPPDPAGACWWENPAVPLEAAQSSVR